MRAVSCRSVIFQASRSSRARIASEMQLRSVLDTHIDNIGSIEKSSLRAVRRAFDLANKFGVSLEAVQRAMSVQDRLFLGI